MTHNYRDYESYFMKEKLIYKNCINLIYNNLFIFIEKPLYKRLLSCYNRECKMNYKLK